MTLVSELAAPVKANANCDIAWIACDAGFPFAMLDATNLANERGFRKLYDNAAKGSVDAWSLTRPPITVGDFLSSLVSWSVLPLSALTVAGAAPVAAVS